MEQRLSTRVVGFILVLKNGNTYELDNSSGEKLEQLLSNKELPQFIRVKADEQNTTISISMIAELKRDVSTVTYKADWL